MLALEAWVAVRASLTNRDMDVLALVDRRLPNREIAERLVVEPRTVKTHLQNTYSKRDVVNRGGAAAMVRRIGLFAKGA